MITKADIIEAIKVVYGVNSIDPITYVFKKYNHTHKTLVNHHPLIDNAIHGGYEKIFYDAIGSVLSVNSFPSLIKFSEREVKGVQDYDFYRKEEGGGKIHIKRNSKDIDIIEVDSSSVDTPTWQKQHVASGIEVAHNHIGQPKEYLIQHFLGDSYCCQKVGIKNLILIGVFDDIKPNGNNIDFLNGLKYQNDLSKAFKTTDLDVETINHIRNECKKIDRDFCHFILYSRSVLNLTIYVHFFILLVPITLSLKFDKRHLKVFL